MNVIILGAGASKSYQDSKTKERMPIATDFFSTFNRLDISKNTWVLVGYILNYLERFHNLRYNDFREYNEDIEKLHSEIENKLFEVFKLNKNGFNDIDGLMTCNAYVQLIFLFNSVINEIQNGLVSKAHLKLAQKLNSNDTILTFNWDTLMDRALEQETGWTTDKGYFVTPYLIYRNEWVSPKPSEKANFPYLIKLHGSTNWLTSYMIAENGKFKLLQEIKPEEFFVYESTIKPYNTYDGRFMSGYNDFSFGYYPPNLPLNGEKLPDNMLLTRTILRTGYNPKGISEDKGLVSMPLIIPPVQDKKYDFYGNLFTGLWGKAEESLIKTDKITLIGYSFPKTDIKTDELFKNAFSKRQTMPEIIIINPFPESIVEKFIFDYGILKDKIKVYKEYFSEEFDFNKID
jgi:hypothetical protein